MHQIRDIFDTELEDLKVDKKLIKTITDLRVGFMNKNQDHLEFFTGNLIGVNPIKYLKNDREDWFDLVLEANEADLKPLLKTVDAIDPTWHRANDVVNMSALWLLYKIHNSSLSPKDKERGLIETVLLLQYKFLSSLLSNFFEYRASREVAIATYEALSRKFDIKQKGSWQGLLMYRSKNIIDRHGIFFPTYSTFNDDQSILNMLTGIQDGLRNIVKKQKDVFDRVREQNLKITATTNTVVFDGEKEIMDVNRDHTDYTRYLKDIITDKPTFIRTELISIVTELLHTVNEGFLIEALEYCSVNFGKGGDKNIELLLDKVMLHTYVFLYDNEGVMSSGNDISKLMASLKNLYLASRMSDPQLIENKNLADKIVSKAITTRNKHSKASVRTALQLYIVLRALSKKYYHG